MDVGLGIRLGVGLIVGLVDALAAALVDTRSVDLVVLGFAVFHCFVAINKQLMCQILNFLAIIYLIRIPNKISQIFKKS